MLENLGPGKHEAHLHGLLKRTDLSVNEGEHACRRRHQQRAGEFGMEGQHGGPSSELDAAEHSGSAADVKHLHVIQSIGILCDACLTGVADLCMIRQLCLLNSRNVLGDLPLF